MSKLNVTEIRIAPEGGDPWSQEALLVKRAGRDLVCLTCDGGERICFSAGEWPTVREAVNEMVASIQLDEASKLREDE